jgi:hypothetical protein
MRAARIARSAAWSVRLLPVRIRPWLLARRNLDRYVVLDETALRPTRHADKLFVFGSGSSLNELTAEEIAEIERHQTLGFNWFVRQEFVRCDYHLIRGIPDTDLDPRVWRPQLEDYFRLLAENPRFANTIYLVQGGFRATNGNRAIGLRLLPAGSRIYHWRTIDDADAPSENLDDGLVHGRSTLQECINFAYLLGWREIVLVGVDLYDRRYFWLDPSETRSVDERRGASAADPHTQAASGLVDTLDRWARWLAERDVRLTVYNPRSLLAGTVPVHPRSGG